MDSAATSQKPEPVLQAMDRYYRNSNANVHRSLYGLAERSTLAFEDARRTVASFLNATSPREIIFTRNTTESINLVAQSWGRANLGADDAVLISEMEHHSNIVPWQLLSEQTGVKVVVLPVLDDGTLDMAAYARLLHEEPVKLVALTHMSNMLGTITPVETIITQAHEAGALVLLDGAQSVPHLPVDVQALDVDFLAFSGHKMLGPTGIGVLYGKRALLEAMPPYMGGGDMIKKVELRSFKANDLPFKFEAGTPAITQSIGLASAAKYLKRISMPLVESHSRELVDMTIEEMNKIEGITVFGPGK